MVKALLATVLVYHLLSFSTLLKCQELDNSISTSATQININQFFVTQLQITNIPSTPVYSQLIITVNNAPEFRITSKPYILNPALSSPTIPTDNLTSSSNHSMIELTGTTLSFLSGKYQICHRIVDIHNDRELIRDCRFLITEEKAKTDYKKQEPNTGKHNVVIKGEVQLQGFHGQSSYLLPNNVQTYFTLSASPKVIVHDIPLGLHINYTSDPLVSHYYNRISFDFNSSEYQEILKDKVLNAAMNEYGELATESEKWDHKKIQLENLNALINDSVLIKEIQKINELEELIGTVDNRQINYLENQLSELINERNTLLEDKSLSDVKSQLEEKIYLIEAELETYKIAAEKLDEFQKLKAKRDQYELYVNKAENLKNEISEYKDMMVLQEKLTKIENEIKDANNLKKYLKEFGLAGKLTPFLMAVKRFSIGETQPYYSELTHWGMPVKGAGIGLKIGNQTFDINSGVSRTLPISPIYYPGQIVRHLPGLQINSGQIGWQKEEGNYLRISGLLAKPKEKLNLSSDNISYEYLKNYRVVSTGFGANIRNGLLTVNGEIGLSVTENLIGTGIREENSPYKDLAKNIFGKKAENGIADIAWKLDLKSQLLNKRLNLRVNSSDIGRNFRTPGNPYLIAGRRNTTINLEYKFLKSAITIGTRFETETFDSSPFQADKIKMRRYGINIKIRPNKLPYIIAGYMPYRRVYRTSNYKYDNINLLAGWNYRLGKISTSTTISYQSNQTYFKPLNDTISFFNNSVLNISQSLQFQKFSLTLNLQRLDGKGWGYTGKQLYAQISSTFYLNQFINGQIGFHLQKPDGQQMDYGYLAVFNWQMNRQISFNFQMNRYQYQAYYDPDIKLTDYSARMGLNIKW